MISIHPIGIQDNFNGNDTQELARQSRSRANFWASGSPNLVAATMGSWTFIIIQSVVLAIWIVVNVIAWISHWDPYPFILLNLALSFQAAYAAPFIMISQNRQAERDRHQADEDYRTNVEAEQRIEDLQRQLAAIEMNVLNRILAISWGKAPALPGVVYRARPTPQRAWAALRWIKSAADQVCCQDFPDRGLTQHICSIRPQVIDELVGETQNRP